MKIIGIDPGSVSLGYGIIKIAEEPEIIDKGIIRIPKNYDRFKKIKILYDQISEILKSEKPEFASIEDSFYHKNVKTTFFLGQIKGAVILALQNIDCKIFEFSPLEIKKAVVGYGQSTKEQVNFMVRKLLHLEGEKLSYDCTDALAAAICLIHSFDFRRKYLRS